MRPRLHHDPLALTGEGGGDRLRYAGMDQSFLTGGAGYVQAPPPPNANGLIVGGDQGAHVGVIGLVVLMVIVLLLLDKAGFRFAVTAGKR